MSAYFVTTWDSQLKVVLLANASNAMEHLARLLIPVFFET